MYKNTKMERLDILSLSHIDLDGIGCQLVLHEVCGHLTRMNINYADIDEYIDVVDDYCMSKHPAKVFITDLSFNIEQLTRLYKVHLNHLHIQFYFIDHHPFKEDYKHLISDTFKIIISDKASATKLTFLFLESSLKIKFKDDVKLLTERVNSYDLWKVTDKHFKAGLMYNDIFWQMKSRPFWYRFKDDYKFTNSEIEMYKKLIIDKNNIFKKIESSGKIFKLDEKSILVIFIDNYKNYVTLEYDDYKYFIIISSNGAISIRIIGDEEYIINGKFKDILIEQILKIENVRNVGGHPKAMGCMLYNKSPHDIIIASKQIMEIMDHTIEQFKGK